MKNFLDLPICVKEKVEGEKWKISASLNGFPAVYELKRGENGRERRGVSRRKGKKAGFFCWERS